MAALITFQSLKKYAKYKIPKAQKINYRLMSVCEANLLKPKNCQKLLSYTAILIKKIQVSEARN